MIAPSLGSDRWERPFLGTNAPSEVAVFRCSLGRNVSPLVGFGRAAKPTRTIFELMFGFTEAAHLAEVATLLQPMLPV